MKLHHTILKRQSLLCVLLGAAVLCFVLTLIKITSFLEASARAQNLVKRASAQDEPIPKNAVETPAASWAVAEQLKKNNLFSPPSPPRHPVTAVLGILGNEALIGDRWYKAGDNIADAQVVCVEPTQVRIRWQGRESAFVPIQGTAQPASGLPASPRQDSEQSNRGASPVPANRPSSPLRRAESAQTVRSARVSVQNRTKPNIEAGRKPQLSVEKLQNRKVLKQDLKALSGETATKKAGIAASAEKKAAATDLKKSPGRLSR